MAEKDFAKKHLEDRAQELGRGERLDVEGGIRNASKRAVFSAVL